MTKLVVKSESTPTRCDICHQSDQYNPNTAICGRCGKLKLSINRIVEISNAKTIYRQLMLCTLAPISFFIGLFQLALSLSAIIQINNRLYSNQLLEAVDQIKIPFLLICLIVNLACFLLAKYGIECTTINKLYEEIIIDKISFFIGIFSCLISILLAALLLIHY